MDRKLSSHTVLIGFISLTLFLALTAFAQAQIPPETWTGSFHFTVKLTTHEKNNAGNHVLVNSQVTFEGAMNFYWDTTTNQPTRGGANNCILELLGDDGTDVCINDMVGTDAETQTKTGWKMTSPFVGIGTFNNTSNGNAGFSYINGKGSTVADISGNPTSIKLSGKINGGFLDSNSKSFIFSGTVPSTALTLAP